MPAIHIVDKYQAIQYTGSNSAEIDGLISSFVIVSESGGNLQFTSSVISATVATGDWIRYTQGAVYSTHSGSEFSDYYIRNATYDDVASIPAVYSVGVKETPTLLLNQSATVAVDIIPAMPDSSYTAVAQLVASSTALGSLSITNITVVDSNTVNVTVQNSGLLNLTGVHLVVVATP